MNNEVLLRRLRIIFSEARNAMKELEVLIEQIEDLEKEPEEPGAYGR